MKRSEVQRYQSYTQGQEEKKKSFSFHFYEGMHWQPNNRVNTTAEW